MRGLLIPTRTVVGHRPSIVGRAEVNLWAARHNAGRIDAFVTLIIVLFDMGKMARLCHAGYLIQVFDVVPQIGITGDAPEVALEMAVAHEVKSNHCRKETPVGLGQCRDTYEELFGEHDFVVIKGGKHVGNRFIVRFLAAGKARAIDAVVHPVVKILNYGIDLLVQR